LKLVAYYLLLVAFFLVLISRLVVSYVYEYAYYICCYTLVSRSNLAADSMLLVLILTLAAKNRTSVSRSKLVRVAYYVCTASFDLETTVVAYSICKCILYLLLVCSRPKLAANNIATY
jgi:hypothetical protein